VVGLQAPVIRPDVNNLPGKQGLTPRKWLHKVIALWCNDFTPPLPGKLIMSKALAYLNQMIARGIDFADACYCASVKFKVDYSDLVADYDNQFSKGY